MSAPYTYEQAIEICEDFEDLEGTELIIRIDSPIKCDIEHITRAPFKREEIDLFIENYNNTKDISTYLQSYIGKEFEVIILARNCANNNELIIQTIQDYIDSNGVLYNFPK